MNENATVAIIISWFFVLIILTIGEPDILDGLIKMVN
jgi:hypothetical protein